MSLVTGFTIFPTVVRCRAEVLRRVIAAAEHMPGVRAVLDHDRERPSDPRMAAYLPPAYAAAGAGRPVRLLDRIRAALAA